MEAVPKVQSLLFFIQLACSCIFPEIQNKGLGLTDRKSQLIHGAMVLVKGGRWEHDSFIKKERIGDIQNAI